MERLSWIALVLVLLAGACAPGAADDDGESTTDTGDSTDTESDSSESGSDTGGYEEIEWVPIPAGRFEMGCSPNDTECSTAEEPVHTVDVPAFEMTRTEITQGQYEAETGENPSRFIDCPSCPVDTVKWPDAMAFCEALGGSLPSEAQWEYAARGNTTSIYACGDDVGCLDDTAWYFDNSQSETHPAGQLEANGFGLHDMLGNVWEWVEDCWHEDYSGDPPTDGSVWEGGDCTYRMVRGGNWGLGATGLRVSNRDGDFEGVYYIPAPGFRCVRSL
jgi:formylglycine-generating enzyme required for sulfatase activity